MGNMQVLFQGMREISVEECADLTCESAISATLDIGGAIIHRASHPKHGGVLIVNTASGRSAVVFG